MRCENITLNSGWTQAGELLRGTQAQITKNGVTDAEAIYKLAEAYSARGAKSSALRVLRRSVEDGFFCYPYSRAIRCSIRFAANRNFPSCYTMPVTAAKSFSTNSLEFVTGIAEPVNRNCRLFLAENAVCLIN
jgi:hypothetical protein